MGSWRGRRSHRRLVALAAALVVIGLPVMARGVTPKTVGPGPVTGFVVRGNTVEITPVQTRFQPIFYTDDLFRIWMAPDGAFTDPANTPPERDGPGRGRQPAG
jgi:alpha-glucosidase